MRLTWSDRSIDHLQAIVAHIAEDDPLAARRVLERIIDLTERLLGEHASIGRPGRVSGTRELVVTRTPYIVVYTVGEETISVEAVVHGARRWPSAF